MCGMYPAILHTLRSWLCVLAFIAVASQALRAAPPEASSDREANATGTADLRPVFERWELTLRGQGNRNTCSVFAITGAMEYALAVKQQAGVRLSIEYLNWASNQEVGEWQDGSFFSDLWDGYEKHGACLESDMPYDATSYDPAQRPSDKARNNAHQLQTHGLKMHWIKKWDPKKGLNEQEFAEVKKTLDRQWPVCGGFLWPKQATWTGSVLDMRPRKGVRDGHSVLLVGYRDDPNQPGGGVFLLRDSGTRRLGGEMSYEYARTYMNDAVWIDYLGAPQLAFEKRELSKAGE